MKKVRYYAVGALGAVPALGLMTPAANAATTVAHSPKSAAKTVSLKHIATPSNPLVTCGTTNSKTGSGNGLHGFILYQNHCVRYQEAHINHGQTGLTERVRYYSAGGGRIHQSRLAGVISGGKTFFSDSPNVTGAYKVCQALVFNGTSTVAYGPTCETT
jgi:hypothetical protein